MGDNELIAFVQEYFPPNDSYLYGFDKGTDDWTEIGRIDLERWSWPVVHNEVLYIYGKAVQDPTYGIYQSSDLGQSWEQIASLEDPNASTMEIHDNTLYLATKADNNDTAYFYKIDLKDEPLFCNGEVVNIKGTDSHDILIGTSGPDVIHGLAGHDVIWGGGGDDTICGGDGNDTIGGGPGNDSLLGEAGHDVLWGGEDDDIMGGFSGNDTLGGGAGNDILYGMGGNDTLNGCTGDDELYGGGGNDTCYDDAGAIADCEVFIPKDSAALEAEELAEEIEDFELENQADTY